MILGRESVFANSQEVSQQKSDATSMYESSNVKDRIIVLSRDSTGGMGSGSSYAQAVYVVKEVEDTV